MALYRCFFLDAADHIFAPPEIFEADDDEAAIDRAQHICDENMACAHVALWCGERHVRRFDRAL
jgi:hypothetical protein